MHYHYVLLTLYTGPIGLGAERVLTEQPFVKENKQSVGQFAAQSGMKLVKFIHWELGKE